MKTKILLFAGLRERFRSSEMELEWPEGTQAQEVFHLLCRNKEEAQQFIRCTLFAINMNYVSPEAPLKEGDELALIPPVAGG